MAVSLRTYLNNQLKAKGMTAAQAKKNAGKYKYIKFGQEGVKTNQTVGQREAFKSRHAKNIKKGKMSAAYWADKVKWSSSKTKSSSKKWVKGS